MDCLWGAAAGGSGGQWRGDRHRGRGVQHPLTLEWQEQGGPGEIRDTSVTQELLQVHQDCFGNISGPGECIAPGH